VKAAAVIALMAMILNKIEEPKAIDSYQLYVVTSW